MSEREIDVNSPDWLDGFQTASAENCFNEKQERDEALAKLQAIREWAEAIVANPNAGQHYLEDANEVLSLLETDPPEGEEPTVWIHRRESPLPPCEICGQDIERGASYVARTDSQPLAHLECFRSEGERGAVSPHTSPCDERGPSLAPEGEKVEARPDRVREAVDEYIEGWLEEHKGATLSPDHPICKLAAAAVAPSPPTQQDSIEPHPEDFCDRCGQRNVPWSAPNELWNAVTRAVGVICPACFTDLARDEGWRLFWKPSTLEQRDQGSHG